VISARLEIHRLIVITPGKEKAIKRIAIACGRVFGAAAVTPLGNTPADRKFTTL
jgi:hypothetical protein